MTKLSNLLLVALMCHIGLPLHAQFSSQQAIDLVLNQVLSADLDHIDVFMLEEPKSGQSTIVLVNDQIVNLPYTSNWVFFVDDKPFANWAHSCRFIFVNTSTGFYQTTDQKFFPLDLKSAYSAISEMERPIPADLPANPNAVITGLDPNPNLYAVIICAYENQIRFWYDVSAIYTTLLNVYGYTKENIFIHYRNGSSSISDDLDGNDIYDDIDYDANKNTIHHTFQEMSGESNTSLEIPILDPEDQLFIFVDGYGYINEGHSYGCDVKYSSGNNPTEIQ